MYILLACLLSTMSDTWQSSSRPDHMAYDLGFKKEYVNSGKEGTLDLDNNSYYSF